MEVHGVHVHYMIFELFKFIFLCMNWLLNTFFKYDLVHGSKTTMIKSNQLHGNLASILFRGCHSPQYPKNNPWELKNYILIHEKYINAEEFILKNDHVTLMGMDENFVWFSVCQKKSIYDIINGYPFVYLSQYWFTEKIFIINHDTFNRISEKCQGPSNDCILITHTGRCGSTLLNQVLG